MIEPTRKPVAAFVVGFVLLLTVAPVAVALGIGFSESSQTPLSARHLRLLGNSLLVSTMAAGVAATFGSIVGHAFGARKTRLNKSLLALALAPFLLPPYAVAAAYIDLAGPRGLAAKTLSNLLGRSIEFPPLQGLLATAFILGLTLAPISVLVYVAGIRRLSQESLEAAGLAIGRGALGRHVLLPLLLPNIRAGALAAWLLTWPYFALPALLQVNTFPVESQLLFTAFNDTAGGIRLGFVQAGIGIGLAAYFSYALLQSAPTSSSHVGTEFEHRPGAASRILAWCYLICGVVLPITLLIERTASLNTFVELARTVQTEFITGLWVAFVTALAATLLACLTAYFVRPPAYKICVTLLASLPFLVSGPVFAIGMEEIFNRPGILGAVYDSKLIIVLACTARYVWMPILICFVATETLSRRGDEAARMSGISWFRNWWSIFTPDLSPALVTAGTLTFILTFQDVDTILQLAPPGTATPPLRVHGLMHYGPDRLVAAMSLMMFIIQLLVVLIGYGLMQKFRNRS